MNKKQYFVIFLLAGFLFSCVKTQNNRDLSIEELHSEGLGDGFMEIIDYGPVGELPNEMTKAPTIYVVFSKPIVPLSKLGQPLKSIAGFEISPSIPGDFYWYGSSMLSFVPSADIMPVRNYTVKIDASKFASLTNEKLEKDFEFNFYSEEVKITNFKSYIKDDRYLNTDDLPLVFAKKFALDFSYPVDLRYIKKFIKVQTADGTGDTSEEVKNYDFTLTRDKSLDKNSNLYKRRVIINLKNELLENKEYCVILEKGAGVDKHSSLTQKDYIVYFHTIKPFKFEEFSQTNNMYYFLPRNNNSLYLYFSHPIDKISIENQIHAYFDVEKYAPEIETYGKIVVLKDLPIVYESTYEVEIGKDIKDIYGRSFDNIEDFPKVLTVKVGKAESYVKFPNNNFSILEAGYPAKISYEYQNIEEVYSKIAKIPNIFKYNYPVLEKVEFSQEANKPNINYVDFSNVLNKQGFGQAYIGHKIKYNPSWFGPHRRENAYYLENHRLIQVTDLAATIKYSSKKALLWIKSMSTGENIPDATVNLYDADELLYSGKSNEHGICIIDFEKDEFFNKQIKVKFDYKLNGLIVEVKKDEDVLVFPARRNYYRTLSYEQGKADYYNHFFTDRNLYKPGEELSFNGIAQVKNNGKYQAFTEKIDLEIYKNSNNGKNTIYQKTFKLKAKDYGNYFDKIKLPEKAELGKYTVKIKIADRIFYHYFEIAEFKRAEFQVNIEDAEMEFLLGENIKLSANANYLSGGDMIDCEYSYFWTKSHGYFRPSNDDFVEYSFGPGIYTAEKILKTEKGQLDQQGSALLECMTEKGETSGTSYSYKVELRVKDESQQELAASRDVFVHAGDYHLGLKADADSKMPWRNYYYKKGEKIDFSLIALGHDGQFFPHNTKADIKILHSEQVEKQIINQYGFKESIWEELETEEYSKFFTIEKNTKVEFNFTPQNTGMYILQAKSKDDAGREIISRLRFYVVENLWALNSATKNIELNTDKPLYRPGEKAKIYINSPLEKGEYLLTLERESIIEEQIIRLDSQTDSLEIEIKEDYLPLVYLSLASPQHRKQSPSEDSSEDLNRPKTYYGRTEILVDYNSKNIELSLQGMKNSFLPGEKAKFRVHASKDGKNLAGARLCFVAVDQGILDLTDYEINNPLDYFYSIDKFPLSVYDSDSRNFLMNPVMEEKQVFKNTLGGEKEVMYSQAMRAGASENLLDSLAQAGSDAIQIRENFNPLAAFIPGIVTDENGYADFEFVFPDRLTKYQATVIAVKEDCFGFEQEKLQVSNPLTVRTAKPQALRIGDKSKFSVILTNLTDERTKVNVEAFSDGLETVGKNEKSISLNPNQTEKLNFEFLAKNEGNARLEFRINSANFREILVEEIDVTKSLNKEAFTILGVTENADFEGFIIPEFEDYGKLTITLSNNPFPAIEQALEVLESSGIMPYNFYDYLHQAYPHILFGKEINNYAKDLTFDQAKIDKLQEEIIYYQDQDGGINLGKYNKNYHSSSDPFLTAKVAEYIIFANKNNIQVMEKAVQTRLFTYLKELNTKEIKQLKPYLFYLRALNGENVEALIKKELSNEKSLDLSAYLYFGLALYENENLEMAKQMLEKTRKFIKVGTQTVDLVQPYNARFYWNNNTRKQLILLTRLYYKLNSIDENLIRYTNTIAKSFKNAYKFGRSDALDYAIAAYEVFNNDENKLKEINAVVRLDDVDLINTSFKGIYSQSFDLSDELFSGFDKNSLLKLNFETKSNEKLFYSANLEYDLPYEEVKARDQGIGVYSEILDKNGRKAKNLKLGETYKMKIILTSVKTYYNLDLIVPLPSGVDAINSSFANTGTYNDLGGIDNFTLRHETQYGDMHKFSNSYAFLPYYNNIEKYIDKNSINYRFRQFNRGQQTIEFLFRATTEGEYPTPPAYAYVVDEAEVFGRSGFVQLRIEN